MLTHLFMLLTKFAHVVLGIGSPQSFPPPLSKDLESEYFKRAAAGDEDARSKLILHNLRLVSHIVKEYYSTVKCQDDLISIGSIGLVKAVDSFSVENGAKFATYAAKCIQNEILMYFRSQKKLGCEVSINETIDMDKEGNPLTYIDVIAVDDTIAEDIDRKIHIANALKCIDTVLSERERTIIILRYGLGKWRARTQREVAELLGISRSYVSRIEKAALEKIKDNLKI